VPGAPLAAGEAYLLRVGGAIADLAGLALAQPVEARFTVATAAAASAPVLDPLAAALCAERLEVSGEAAPGAAVQVRLGDLGFSSFADAAGRFVVGVPLGGSGYHLLRVRASDPATGAVSAEVSAVVRVDCHGPAVIEARLDRQAARVTVVFSEA